MTIQNSSVEALLGERLERLIATSGGKRNVCPIKLMTLAEELGLSSEEVKTEFERC